MSEWYEKEQRFEKAFFDGKIPTSIWKYIPDNLMDAIADTAVTSDGYWVYLNEGWRAYDHAEDCGTIHTYTIADLRNDLKTIKEMKK